MIMKWSKKEILNTQDDIITFDEIVSFEQAVFLKNHHVRDVQDIHISGTLCYNLQSDFATCDFEIQGTMILPCAITNEDVTYPFSTKGSETFAFHKVEDHDAIIEAKGDVIELMPIIFQNIMMEVPLKVVKEDIKEYPKGDGWEVVKESDYENQKKQEVDPRFAKLNEFKIKED
ncbi:MAG: YceD family protein [Breznakia sp.]